jgi:hypothetical protein
MPKFKRQENSVLFYISTLHKNLWCGYKFT